MTVENTKILEVERVTEEVYRFLIIGIQDDVKSIEEIIEVSESQWRFVKSYLNLVYPELTVRSDWFEKAMREIKE